MGKEAKLIALLKRKTVQERGLFLVRYLRSIREHKQTKHRIKQRSV